MIIVLLVPALFLGPFLLASHESPLALPLALFLYLLTSILLLVWAFSPRALKNTLRRLSDKSRLADQIHFLLLWHIISFSTLSFAYWHTYEPGSITYVWAKHPLEYMGDIPVFSKFMALWVAFGLDEFLNTLTFGLANVFDIRISPFRFQGSVALSILLVSYRVTVALCALRFMLNLHKRSEE